MSHSFRFSSQNLSFRPVSYDNRQDVVMLYSDPKVTQYIDMASSNVSPEMAFDRIIEANKKPQSVGIYWAVSSLDNRFMGLQGLTLDSENYCRAEIGIMMMPRYAKVGMATEALAAMINFAFTEMPLTDLFAYFDPRNKSVEQLASRLNFDQVTDRFCAYSKQHWASIYSVDNSLRFNC